MADSQAIDREVRYPGNGCEIKAFSATPAAGSDPWPAVIVVQEWWGLDDHIKDVARRFAAEGYFAIAPDLYSRQGHKVTKDPDVAADLMSALNASDGIDDLLSTIAWLKTQPTADSAHIGVIGFCMGGSYATSLPCVSKDIKQRRRFMARFRRTTSWKISDVRFFTPTAKTMVGSSGPTSIARRRR